ncbi:zf-C3HC-domain-containing protein [Melanomma pulvis-pyrius CBS 109.77]|uniref:Zf-C3HC-domain-containing protein n=1 Tax=Melanomma pulvis-pyrius CBS 109.77 TaxID=1314802 RepID=A0A6A6XIF7_9PLEO|nr:zf-C3HC-domain-containing protein [Melanomma pulvis-pyrius CBS 109.77]
MDADIQPALATTKRKFNRLLDNLTASASTSSLASTLQESNASTASISNADPTTPEPAPKRSRLSDVSVSMERPRNVSGNDRIRALQDKLFTPRAETNRFAGTGVRSVGTKTSAQPTTPRKTPNFAPYSQEQFLVRLKSFADVKKWTNKPDAIGEVEWAKRGWVCDTWNTVACKGGCEQRVVVKLRPKRKDRDGKEIEMSEDLAVEIDEGLVEKYYELVLDGHHEDCLWRKAGCKDEIYHIPIPSRTKSSAELLDRYESFKAISNDLPLLENITYPDPPVSDVLARIPTAFWSPPGSTTPHEPPTSPSDIAAFTFALFGWSGVSESKIALATCSHCFQRIGLWLSNDARLKEMSAKLDVPIESLRLNLLESHREHCPWKNPITQGNPKNGPIENMAAWQTLEFMLMGKKKEVRPVIEDMRRDDSFDIGRGSIDSAVSVADADKDDSLNEKWKRFKAKLRRTTSRKSLKSSSKSVKSARSVKSVKSVGGDKEKENEGAKGAKGA